MRHENFWARHIIRRYKRGDRNFARIRQPHARSKRKLLDPRPDFRGANLRGANFEKADLSRCLFAKAVLAGANLRGANLDWSRLRGADLTGADLREATLYYADLRGAKLTRADLSGADLLEAQLIGADLVEADLSGANLKRVILAGDSGVSVRMAGARLKGAAITDEQDGTARASFLELASVEDLEDVDFGDPDRLSDYISRAFAYLHGQDVPEASQYPEFFETVLSRIKTIRAVYAEQPPQMLVEAVQSINRELLAYVKRHPEALYQVKWQVFEEIIAELLAGFGWEVDLTRLTRDGGYDIFAIRNDAGLRSTWIVECKLYQPKNKVGIDIARALYGVKADLRVGMALLATTSHFTKDVHAFKSSRYDFELRDFEGILEWINEYKPNPEGKLYVRNNRIVSPGDPG